MWMINILLFIIFVLIEYCNAYWLGYGTPCIYGENNSPSGCQQRIKECHEIDKSGIPVSHQLFHGVNYECQHQSPKLGDTINNMYGNNNVYYVEFDDVNNNCYGIVMRGGECWGDSPNGGDYNCMGRCGGGCGGGWGQCSNWARDCLKHDVCSWFFGSSGALFDENCGDEWQQGTWDYTSCCYSWCGAVCAGDHDSC